MCHRYHTHIAPLLHLCYLCVTSSCRDGEASEASEALKAQLVASLGSQNLVMYGVEGVREVTASVMAGVAYVATGNLAAPLAGSIVVQVGRLTPGCLESQCSVLVCYVLPFESAGGGGCCLGLDAA